MRKPGQIGPDNLQGKFITGSYLKGYTPASPRRRAPPTAARRAARAPTARARASTTTCSPRTTPRSSGAPQLSLSRAHLLVPQLRPWRSAPIPRRFPDYHGDFLTPPPAARRSPRFGDLQGTKGNPERSAAISGAAQFIFGYLALLTERRACARAPPPPNVVLHNFDTNASRSSGSRRRSRSRRSPSVPVRRRAVYVCPTADVGCEDGRCVYRSRFSHAYGAPSDGNMTPRSPARGGAASAGATPVVGAARPGGGRRRRRRRADARARAAVPAPPAVGARGELRAYQPARLAAWRPPRKAAAVGNGRASPARCPRRVGLAWLACRPLASIFGAALSAVGGMSGSARPCTPRRLSRPPRRRR